MRLALFIGRQMDKEHLLITLSVMVLRVSTGIPHHLRTDVRQGYFAFVYFLKQEGKVEAEKSHRSSWTTSDCHPQDNLLSTHTADFTSISFFTHFILVYLKAESWGSTRNLVLRPLPSECSPIFSPVEMIFSSPVLSVHTISLLSVTLCGLNEGFGANFQLIYSFFILLTVSWG